MAPHERRDGAVQRLEHSHRHPGGRFRRSGREGVAHAGLGASARTDRSARCRAWLGGHDPLARARRQHGRARIFGARPRELRGGGEGGAHELDRRRSELRGGRYERGDPVAGFIATANGDITGASRFGDPLTPAPGAGPIQSVARAEGTRLQRILDSIEATGTGNTLETMRQLQGDTKSLVAETIVPRLIAAASAAPEGGFTPDAAPTRALVAALAAYQAAGSYSCPTGLDGLDPFTASNAVAVAESSCAHCARTATTRPARPSGSTKTPTTRRPARRSFSVRSPRRAQSCRATE
jgi:hypothetical protein